MKYILETKDGDRWEFDNLEEAERNKYIFGGFISKVVTFEEIQENEKNHP